MVEMADTKMAEMEGRRSDPAALGAGGREDSDLVMILMKDKVMIMIDKVMMWMILMILMIMMMENSDQGKSKLQ